MNKFIILSVLLIGSTLSLNPSTPLPAQFDDMLFNNLSEQIKKYDTSATHVTHTNLDLSYVKFFTKKVASTLFPKSDLKNAEAIMDQTIDRAIAGEDYSSYHAFFAAFDYKFKIVRTYEMTLFRMTNKINLVFSKKNHDLWEADKFTFYTKTYESHFGLPFMNEVQSEINDSEITSDFVDFLRAYLLNSALDKRGSQEEAHQQISNGLSGIMGGIKSIVGVVKDIKDAFKNKKTETLKRIDKGEGFRKWAQKSRSIRQIGVPADKYDRFKKYYLILTGLEKTKYTREINAILELAEFTDQNQWSVNDFNFDTGHGKLDTVVALTGNDMEKMKFSFLTIKLTGSFELAPDVLLYHKTKSLAGGFWETEKDVRKEVPRNISKEEVEAVQSLMILSALNVMCKTFGIPFKLPDNPKDV